MIGLVPDDNGFYFSISNTVVKLYSVKKVLILSKKVLQSFLTPFDHLVKGDIIEIKICA